MSSSKSLVRATIDSADELQIYRRHAPVRPSNAVQDSNSTKHVLVDGKSLTIAGLVATARYGLTPALDSSPQVTKRIQDSVDCLAEKLERGESLYGINTGFGGSADSRTPNMPALQLALLQHQQCGILPVPGGFPAQTQSPTFSYLPLSGQAYDSLSQPESWVRGAILVRLNSLMRGHSGVRWEVLERMTKLLEYRITPLVPLRGSISASGDLSPLSYVAGTLAGQEGIYCWIDGPNRTRISVPASVALKQYGIPPTVFAPKEALGILNGTAFSASVGSLVLHEASHLALLCQVITAMSVEASTGTDSSFAPFIHQEARPHPGQIESAEVILGLLQGSELATHMADEKHVGIDEDEGSLRQDRYPLRTSAQWIGPQLEDINNARTSVQIELNSTTDNPLIEVATGQIHHGGNFQAMAVTNAMEKTRLSLQHFGKLIFSQVTELINPSMSRGLAANLAATDPSLNFHLKGVDIGIAAVTAELGFLANPVSTHVQSAEMANQAVNSLALISARYTIASIETLSQLFSWALYALCQAFDLRALQRKVEAQLEDSIESSIGQFFGTWINSTDQKVLAKKVSMRLSKRMDETSARDLKARLEDAYMQAGYELIAYFSKLPSGGGSDPLRTIMAWRDASAAETHALYKKITKEFLEDPKACHAAPMLGKTAPIYIYIRRSLGVPMHGKENMHEFKGEEGKMRETIGGYVSVIYQSISSGDMYSVLVDTIKGLSLSPGNARL